jgi:hypothetical protein
MHTAISLYSQLQLQSHLSSNKRSLSLKSPSASLAFIATIYFFIFIPSCFADLVLTAPPRETPEAGHTVYAPLADYLSVLLGEPVIYEHPINWKRYEKKMKNDEYDIIFDGPHFAAWRIETLLAKPLIKLPGSLRFVLVVKKLDIGMITTKDMIGKTICTLPAPNLGALTLYSMFPHPPPQPE